MSVIDTATETLSANTRDTRCSTPGCNGHFEPRKWRHSRLCNDCRTARAQAIKVKRYWRRKSLKIEKVEQARVRKLERMMVTAARNAEIVYLRQDKRLSISILGERYGISRQRIQQIVGKTGHIALVRMKRKVE